MSAAIGFMGVCCADGCGAGSLDDGWNDGDADAVALDVLVSTFTFTLGLPSIPIPIPIPPRPDINEFIISGFAIACCAIFASIGFDKSAFKSKGCGFVCDG